MSEHQLTINGRQVSATAGQTILEVAEANGIDIPHLCHDPRLEPVGACRMCLVEIEGERGLQTACTRKALDGMVVQTNTEEIVDIRKTILGLFLSEHRFNCGVCDKDGECLLQQYAYQYQVDDKMFGAREFEEPEPNYTSENRLIEYDPTKCIRCQRCVRVCEEVEMANALTMRSRATDVQVSTSFGIPLNESTCELCGLCVSTCPTGALYERSAKGQGQCKDLVKVRTTCPYCGVGCQMDLNVNPKTNTIVRVTGEPGCIPNDGNLCVKGRFGFHFVHSPERLTTPLIREGDSFRKASWEEAITLTGSRLREIRDKYGPDSIAFLSSCRCSNEENYLMQKIARTAGATNMVDQCATTCHAPTVAGLASAFGSGAMTNSVGEVKDVQTLFIIGSNPTEAHPIVGMEMKKALRKGAFVVVCDPRKTWMARHAHIHVQHMPGTDNMLINAMMNYIIEKGLHDKSFVEQRCEEFEAFRENLKEYTIDKAADLCRVDADLIRQATEAYAKGTPSSIFYTLGITEHTCGTENVQNLANMAMLCGQIGKASSGVNPLRGQNNVQGGCDMGAMPHVLPGYQKWSDPEVRAKFEKLWGVKLPDNEGGRVTDFIENAGDGILRGFYCMGEDPVMSEPNQTKVIRYLKQVEFIACQEIFMSETAKLAHVILPGACYAEKDGTFTNTERRVQRIRKAVNPPGECKPDWQIVCMVSTAMGYPMVYEHPGQIWDELASLTPSLTGINYERIDEVGLQWPCPTTDHPGTKFLHEGKFVRGQGLFHVIKYRPPAEVPDDEYPLVLSTGRTLYHYNVGNMTRKTDGINQKLPDCFVEVCQEDADRLRISQSEKVKVSTRRGEVVARASVGERARPGVIWMPFHFAESSANLLTNDQFDNITKTGEYKACAARIDKL